MPRSWPAAARRRVRATSSAEGSGSPLGWLWASEDRGAPGEDRGLEDFARMYERGGQASDGNRVQAEDAVPDGQERDGEDLAVGLADVLGQNRHGLGRRAELRPLGEL